MDVLVDGLDPADDRPRRIGQEPPLLLRAEEAARLLGLGRSTVFGLLATGDLPAIRVGRSVRVSRTAIEQFIAAREAAK